METFEKLKKMLCKELDELVEKGDLKAGSLDVVDKLTHSIKSLDTIIAMEEAGYSRDGGYSGARRRDSMGRFAYDHYDDGNYYGGYSGRRYSRDEGKSQMIDHMEDMMEKAESSQVREVLQSAISKLKNM